MCMFSLYSTIFMMWFIIEWMNAWPNLCFSWIDLWLFIANAYNCVEGKWFSFLTCVDMRLQGQKRIFVDAINPRSCEDNHLVDGEVHFLFASIRLCINDLDLWEDIRLYIYIYFGSGKSPREEIFVRWKHTTIVGDSNGEGNIFYYFFFLP